MIPYQEQDAPPALRRLACDKSTGQDACPSRRQFLKLGVATGFALGMVPALASDQGATPAPELKPNQLPGGFVKIASDGTVTVVVNRVELGQGAHTALPMLLAEELDADWSLVRSESGSNDAKYADPVFGFHITGGSASTKNSFMHYRELGGRARAMLMQAAAVRWGADLSKLKTQRGAVLHVNGQRLGYGELAAEAMALPVPRSVALKDPREFQIIGRPVARLDSKAKSTGQQAFSIDMALPGQLTAVVAHPAVFGARVRTVDDVAARAIKGVRAVVRIPLVNGGEGVAVVADGFWPAKQGRDALQITWNDEGVEKVDSARQLDAYRELAKTPGKLAMDANTAPIAKAQRVIRAEFTFPYLAHASMEPISCTVDFKGDQAELWVGSQFPGFDTGAAARVLGLQPAQIKMNVMMAGGGFGRRGVFASDFVVEACGIAKAARAAGVIGPVRMVWTREDDIRGGYYRPMHLHLAEVAFDAAGKVLAWDHRIVGQSIMAGTPSEPVFVKDGVDGLTVEGMRGPYPLPMRLTVHHPRVNVPVQVWRGVGHTHTAFVMETLLDEVCRRTGRDPVAYRMALLGNDHPRHRSALQLAVDRSGYGKARLPAGRAWGVAVHESYESVVAYVVEASVKNGQPILHKVTAGVHCNMAIHPRMVEDQVQGAALMGLGTCLPGAAITLKDGVVEQQNFGDYPVPRITDMPSIAVHIVPSADPPTGMGEPGLPPLAPAFANAITRLTGKPLRGLPFKLA
jgi:isoquinoline 1-oxidoreductase subunit beta